MKQSNETEIKKFYAHARDTLSLLFPVVYALYFPMTWLLLLWLPQYANSMAYLVFILPICVFDSKMDITCTTVFKVTREESRLLYINVVTVVFSALGVLLGTYVFQSVYVAIMATVAAIVARSIYSEHIVARKLSVGDTSITVFEIVLTLSFITMAELLPPDVAFFGY